MIQKSQELEVIGKALFTKWGGVNNQFLTKKNGQLGVFGPEIGSHSLALLCGEENLSDHDFRIEKEFCRRGVGTTALKKLFQHKSLYVCMDQYLFTSTNWRITFLQHASFMLVYPSVNHFPQQYPGKPLEKKALDSIIRFFRTVRFYAPLSFIVFLIPRRSDSVA